MSDLRVALVAEGPTDAVVIEAVLKAILPRPFVLNLLQPEKKRPKMGTGWGGVLRWCLDFAMRGHARFEDDPTLPGYDLFVVHADADVAGAAYAHVSHEVACLAAERGWHVVLPSDVPCPPASGSADAVRGCLLSWTGIGAPGPRTVLCVPSKAIDAWLVAAAFDNGHALLTDLECNLDIEGQLRVLPKTQRIKKTKRQYLAYEKVVAEKWPVVRQRCTQAERFSTDIAAVFI